VTAVLTLVHVTINGCIIVCLYSISHCIVCTIPMSTFVAILQRLDSIATDTYNKNCYI